MEEVWEKQDHMDGQDFDPKTFFMLHDLDGNNFWDETEVKTLFVKELDKVYQQGGEHSKIHFPLVTDKHFLLCLTNKRTISETFLI